MFLKTTTDMNAQILYVTFDRRGAYYMYTLYLLTTAQILISDKEDAGYMVLESILFILH